MEISSTKKQEIGRLAEDFVLAQLQGECWELLVRNWRWRGGELDLVMRRGRVLLVVEVRCRTRHQTEFSWISPKKIRTLRSGVAAYLAAGVPVGIEEIALELAQVNEDENREWVRVPIY